MRGWFKRWGLVAALIGRLVLTFIGWSIHLLAAGAKTEAADDEASCAIRGCVLNYRTGKLDDGTDPYGWYKRD